MRSYGKETLTEHAQKLQGKALSSLETLQNAECNKKEQIKLKNQNLKFGKLLVKKVSKFGKKFYQRW